MYEFVGVDGSERELSASDESGSTDGSKSAVSVIEIGSRTS